MSLLEFGQIKSLAGLQTNVHVPPLLLSPSKAKNIVDRSKTQQLFSLCPVEFALSPSSPSWS